MKLDFQQALKYAALFLTLALMPVSSFAADRVEGRVEGGGQPIVGAEVTLWLAGAVARGLPLVPGERSRTRVIL